MKKIIGIISLLLFYPLWSQKPNIVFILADDLGTNQVSAYGSKFYNTPNIDQLAHEGMKFTNAYTAAAVCSPTRASLLTGQHPARIKLTDFIPGNKKSNYPLLQPSWQKHLPLKAYTLGELFKSQNYRTAWFGKWHLSKSKTPPNSLTHNPEQQGFDESFITYKPAKGLHLQPWQTPEEDAHNVQHITSKALTFMEQNQKNPFFLMLSHNSIHDPLMEKNKLIQRYQQNPLSKKPENHATIAAMMETLDQSVGRIIKKLDELNLSQNTLIIFYADNGGKHAYAIQRPFRKGKGWLYEGGIRVPLLLKWPKHIKPNSVNHNMVTSTDFLPTFAEIINASNLDSKPIDGISVLSTLQKQKSLKRETLYWHYPHYHKGSGMTPASALRYKNFKLIQWHESLLLNTGNTYELYDLSKDPGETKDLKDQHPKLTQKLILKLQQWKKRVGAQSMLVNQTNITKKGQ